MAFASGIHCCLGAHLARLEAATVFARLLELFPRIERASAPRRRPDLGIRGFAEYPLHVAPADGVH